MKNSGTHLALIFLLWTLIHSTLCFAQNDKKTTVIFVCEHGGARSTIASLYFNRMAHENDLPYRSVFRGLTPEATITNETRKGLIADGFQTTKLTPVALAMKDVDKNTLLISLDCAVPSSYGTFQAWTGIPPISTDYRAAREEIVRQLNQLIIELKKRQ